MVPPFVAVLIILTKFILDFGIQFTGQPVTRRSHPLMFNLLYVVDFFFFCKFFSPSVNFDTKFTKLIALAFI